MKKIFFIILSNFTTSAVFADISDHGRVLDESSSSKDTLPFFVILGIILCIVSIYFYFISKDPQTGERDKGCGCLVLLALGATILGISVLNS